MTVEVNQTAELSRGANASKHSRAVLLSLPEDAPLAPTTAACDRSEARGDRASATASADNSSVGLKRSVRGSHRRAQTIVAAGRLELQQLQQLMQMEVLQHDLESKSKELEESQEEAHLAALIGQSLLQRTEEMGAEIESTAMELLSRAENAEHEAKILEAKLSKAYAHIRSMEIAKAKSVDESDEISHEVETLRLRMRVLQAEVAKAHDETQETRIAKEDAVDELGTTKDALQSLQTAHTRLLSDWSVQAKRVQELEAAERYNLEHIARLEIENQSICLQHRMQERRERQLQSEHEALANKMASQRQLVRDVDAAKLELERVIETLTAELDDLKDALATEQLRVAHLTKHNQELQDRLDNSDATPEHARGASNASPLGSTRMLRSGSLFYELSMQLKDEMRQASQHQHQQQQQVQVGSEGANQQSRQDTASGASKAAARRPFALELDSDSDDNNDDANDSAATGAAAHRADARDSDENDEDEDNDILKEFFMLTAAAVKIAGGGLGNDACNILNEDLYEEALREGLTFDQYHKWLERRLEGAPEVDSANKTPATAPSAAARSPRTLASAGSSRNNTGIRRNSVRQLL